MTFTSIFPGCYSGRWPHIHFEVYAALLVVTVQAFALHTTLAVFLSPQANSRALGIPADPAGSVNLLIVVCLLWTTVRIPAMARRYVTRSRPAAAATMIRVLLVQQLTRGLARAGGAGRLLARRP